MSNAVHTFSAINLKKKKIVSVELLVAVLTIVQAFFNFCAGCYGIFTHCQFTSYGFVVDGKRN